MTRPRGERPHFTAGRAAWGCVQLDTVCNLLPTDLYASLHATGDSH